MKDNEKALEQRVAVLEALLAEKEQKPTEPKKKAQPDKDQACRAITKEEFYEIIEALQTGFSGCRPNPRAAKALWLEANTGLRISDIVKLKLRDIVPEGGRRRLNIQEEKTKKWRRFTVHEEVYNHLVQYCYENNIGPDEVIFDITPRSIQRQLAKVVDWLDYDGRISTHSFRKLFATSIYTESGYNIALIQELLQHSSAETTRRYLTIGSKQVEEALDKHILL